MQVIRVATKRLEEKKTGDAKSYSTDKTENTF